MSALRIVKDGAPVLKKTAAPVKTITKRVKRLLDDMAETMYSAEGVGLAAPQVNESLQIVVLDDGNGLIELINRKFWTCRKKRNTALKVVSVYRVYTEMYPDIPK